MAKKEQLLGKDLFTKELGRAAERPDDDGRSDDEPVLHSPTNKVKRNCVNYGTKPVK
jgi:hypothetical protein